MFAHRKDWPERQFFMVGRPPPNRNRFAAETQCFAAYSQEKYCLATHELRKRRVNEGPACGADAKPQRRGYYVNSEPARRRTPGWNGHKLGDCEIRSSGGQRRLTALPRSADASAPRPSSAWRRESKQQQLM